MTEDSVLTFCVECQQHRHAGHVLRQVCGHGHDVAVFVCVGCAQLPKWSSVISQIRRLPKVMEI